MNEDLTCRACGKAKVTVIKRLMPPDNADRREVVYERRRPRRQYPSRDRDELFSGNPEA